MKLVPDVKTAYLDPFRAEKTLIMNFSIVDPFTDEPYSRDPRNIAAKAEAYLKSTGIADTAFFGAEAEFYVFDDVRFETKANELLLHRLRRGCLEHRRVEEGGNRGYKTRYKGGYFPVPPVDHFADLRDEMCLNLAEVGLEVERSHHEVGTAGQQEINYRFNTLLQSGDDMMKFKYVVKNTAWERQDRDLHAEADLRRQRLGHAHPPVAVEGRRAAVLRREAATAASPTWPAGTSAACSSTPRRCWPSPTRR
jgi:glutamine synthetase